MQLRHHLEVAVLIARSRAESTLPLTDNSLPRSFWNSARYLTHLWQRDRHRHDPHATQSAETAFEVLSCTVLLRTAATSPTDLAFASEWEAETRPTWVNELERGSLAKRLHLERLARRLDRWQRFLTTDSGPDAAHVRNLALVDCHWALLRTSLATLLPKRHVTDSLRAAVHRALQEDALATWSSHDAGPPPRPAFWNKTRSTKPFPDSPRHLGHG